MSDAMAWGVIIALCISSAGNIKMWSLLVSLRKEVTKLTGAVANACPWGSCPSYEKAKKTLERPENAGGS